MWLSFQSLPLFALRSGRNTVDLSYSESVVVLYKASLVHFQQTQKPVHLVVVVVVCYISN